MIVYTTANTESDLWGILNLQKANLKKNLPRDEITSQGFVTVTHSFDDLKKLNEIERHIIAKDENSVIAYLLAMTERSKNNIPILVSMFEIFNQISFAGKFIAGYNYIVVGQVCVSKNYRGQGVLDKAYSKYKNLYKNKYDFAITEIVSKNQRSINAHKRNGFTEIHRYKDQDATEWVIVLWDWKNMR